MPKPKTDDDIPPELNPADINPEPAPTVNNDTSGYTGSPFQPEWRSALDDPKHPQHNLRNA